jgi:hypothetical protein
MNLTVAARDLLYVVIRPTFSRIGLSGKAAEELLLGTALVESGTLGFRLFQAGSGSAMSPWQIKPETHRLIWRWLWSKAGPSLPFGVLSLAWEGREDIRTGKVDAHQTLLPELPFNLRLACAEARCLYRSIPYLLPAAGDYAAQARYWKRWYNTPKGRGDPARYVELMERVEEIL